MNGRTYPYLDLAALPAVGDALLDPRPAFVFSADGARLLWANAAGAAFFGERRMGDLLARRFSDLNPLKAQLARLVAPAAERDGAPGDPPHRPRRRPGDAAGRLPAAQSCRRRPRRAGGRRGRRAGGVARRARRALADAIGAGDCLAAVLDRRRQGARRLRRLRRPDAGEPAIDALIAAARASARAHRQAADHCRRTRATGRRGALQRATGATLPADRRAGGRDARPPRRSRLRRAAADEVDAAIETPVEAMLPDARRCRPRRAPPKRRRRRSPAPVVRFVWRDGRATARFTFVSPELAERSAQRTRPSSAGVGEDVAARPRPRPGGRVAAALRRRRLRRHRLLAGRRRRRTRSRSTSPACRSSRGESARRLPRLRRVPSGRSATGRSEPTRAELVDAPPTGSAGSAVAATNRRRAAERRAADPRDQRRSRRRGAEEHRGRRRGTAPAADARRDELDSRSRRRAPSAPSNIVRLPGAQPSRTPPEQLTGTEQDAFRRIAEALGTQRPRASARLAGRGRRRRRPEPAAKPPSAPAAEIDTRLLDRLPIGIVVFRDRKTLFANRTLLDLLGYDTLDAFVAAGGAEAIFPGSEGLAGNIAEAGGRLAATPARRRRRCRSRRGSTRSPSPARPR